jgi:ribosomal protein S27E
MEIDLSRYCWVCGGTFAQPSPTKGDVTEVDCTTCGQYDITGSLL